MGEEAFELGDLLSQARVAGLRLGANPVEALLDVIAVGDDELELDRLQVVGGIRLRAEVVQHGDQGVRLAQLAEDGRAQTGRVDEPDRRRRRLGGALDLRDGIEPLVRNRRDAHVLLAVRRRRDAREGGEEGRLARARQAHDSDVQRHDSGKVLATSSPLRSY